MKCYNNILLAIKKAGSCWVRETISNTKSVCDTDTIACIVGGMIGLISPIDWITEEVKIVR